MAACGVCGEAHPGRTCPTLLSALGSLDRSADLAPRDGPVNPLLGAELGGWELTGVLGSGSFGVVYRAVHRETGEPAALKLLHAYLARDPEVVRRFVGEARAALLVGHENVVQVKAIDTLEGQRYYIVLELLEGETLEQRLERGLIPFEQAAPLLRQLCDALGAAHAVGIVHRDLKPENVYLALKDHRVIVKVMDFGVARRSYLSTGEKRTQGGLVLGTPLYLSPEQSMGEEVDQRSDVYSLGVIMFRMLTGRLPFEGANAVEVIMAHRQRPPPRPSALVPRLPPAVDDIVLKALAKAPADRYQAMGSFEADLGAALESAQAFGFRPPSPTEDLLLAIEATPPEEHYRLLGVREGAGDEAIRSAAARLWQRFDLGRATADGELFVRLDAAARRVSDAEALLLDQAARAWFDAGRGNFVGVARALANGFSPEALQGLRARFVAQRPELAFPAPPPRPAASTPAEEDALALELARRLREDPLNLELHRLYWPLRGAQRQRARTELGAQPVAS